jgi:hypothetical protein
MDSITPGPGTISRINTCVCVIDLIRQRVEIIFVLDIWFDLTFKKGTFELRDDRSQGNRYSMGSSERPKPSVLFNNPGPGGNILSIYFMRKTA